MSPPIRFATEHSGQVERIVLDRPNGNVLDLEMRWRDPDRHTQVFRGVRRHIHRRLHTCEGIELQRAISDEKFVFRNLHSVLSPVDWTSWGDSFPEPADPVDRETVLSMTGRGLHG